MIFENELNVYNFDESEFLIRRGDDEVLPVTIRLNGERLSVIPLDNRLMFTVPGPSTTFIVHGLSR